MTIRQEAEPEPSRMGTTLVVLGTHHSGGAALSAALEQCGARLVGRQVLDAMCDGILLGTGVHHLGGDDAQGVRVLEDPRLCLLFPALRTRVPNPVCIHVFRNPLGVANALRAESGLDVAEGLARWEACNLGALRGSEGLARVPVSYEELVARPRECLERLLQRLGGLGVRGIELPDGWAFRELQESDEGAEGLLTASQAELWQRLSLGQLDGGPEYKAGCKDLERALQARVGQIASLKSTTKEQASEIGILSQRVAWLDAQIVELQASNSWRVTAPLRSLSTALGKLRDTLRGSSEGRQGRLGRRQASAAGARAPVALAGEDSFVLYRIIGNDLYPRHKRGQAVENLRFVLEHEPELEGCEKRFVLNRILDPEQERDIIGLLERAGCGYFRIPFDPGEYAATGFDIDALPVPGFLSGEEFDALDDAGKDRLFAALYRLKNNYVMNNNGARNAALQDGRGRAKWVLPWDGNCFLTRAAWEGIRRDVARAPENRYFVVPMARMPSNEPLIRGGNIPRAVEEPQIIFRTDAEERFNPEFCYGRRPKVELLWRLDVRGPWDDYPDDPWDQKRAPVSPGADAVGRAGWVARLSSGMTTLEADSGHAPLHRGFARASAIMSTLQHLDARIAGVDSEHPMSIRVPVLRQEIENRNVPALKDVVGALLRAADEAMDRQPGANEEAGAGLQRTFADSLVLALAWSFSGVDRYAGRGSEILGRLVGEPGVSAGPTGTWGLYYHLDAVRIFERAGSVGEAVKAGFRAGLEARLQWLLTSPEGVAERRAHDHRGTCYDLQVASIASFLDHHEVVYEALVRAQARIGVQFDPDGGQPGELGGATTAHHCCFNLQSWINLAELASRWGVDLWGYRAPNGSGLGQGARWLLSRMDGSWPWKQVGAFDVDRLQPIRFAAMEFVDDLPKDGKAGSSPYAVRPVFPPNDGIRPFWNLGRHGSPGGSDSG